MLNISLLASTKVELWDLTVVLQKFSNVLRQMEKKLKVCNDFDLIPTMPNIELV